MPPSPLSPHYAQHDGDGDGPSNSSTPSTSVATTSTLATIQSAGPSTPTAGASFNVTSPLIPPGSPLGKTSFQLGSASIDRPWVRTESALLSPSRCSSQFFDDGPSPYVIAELEAPRPLYTRAFSDTSSMSSRFSLLPDPNTWGSAVHMVDDPSSAEPDDDLHTPDPMRDKTVDKGGTIWTGRGVLNLGCMLLLCASLFGLFAGFPVAYYFTHKNWHPTKPAESSNSTNSTGQVPVGSARRVELYDPGGR